jgi:hypothetical protein
MMEIKSENKPMTFDEVLQTPELAQLHDLIRYLEKTPNKDIFPRKYEMSIEDLTIREVRKVVKEQPYSSLKAVITTVLGKLPDDLSANLLLKMTQLTIKEWGKLTNTVAMKEDMLQAA